MEKIIDNYPNYTVDETGIVRSIKSGKVKAQQIYAGYKCVLLWNGGAGKWEKVHRLVAQAFVPNPQYLPCVNHIDENKTNNKVSNLEWCSYSYNNSYGANAPLKKMQQARKKRVVQYDATTLEPIAEYESTVEAGRVTGITSANIAGCCRNKPYCKTAGGFIWRYKNQIK